MVRRKKDWFGWDLVQTTLPTALMTIPLYWAILLAAQMATPTSIFEGELLGMRSAFGLFWLFIPSAAGLFFLTDRFFDWVESH